MPGRLVAILGTKYPDFSIEEDVLGELGVRFEWGPGRTPAEVVSLARNAEVVLAGSGPRFGADVLRQLQCRGIVRYGTGTDTIDLAAARQLRIAVVAISDYGTEAVAFHAVALAATQLRRLPSADRVVRAGSWSVDRLRPLHLPSALTAGVIGYGRIGRHTAGLFAGLGFRVCAYDPVAPPHDGIATAVDLAPLLESSDIVSLHAPGQPDGRPLLDAAALQRMKSGSVLINTARGSLVDLEALVEGLRSGRPALAALDVLPDEPPDLLRLAEFGDRVLLTPHMAWYTEESEHDLRRRAAEEAGRLLRGEPLRDAVVEP